MTAPNPAAGKPIDPSALANVPRLVTAYFAGGMSPLMLSIVTTAIMIVVAAWESISLRSDPSAEE